MSFLLPIRNWLQNKIRGLHQQIASAGLLSRLFLLLPLVFAYSLLGIILAASIIFGNSQTSFSLFNTLQPAAAYSSSYTQHKKNQLRIKVGALSGLLVLVLFNVFGGIFVTKDPSLAADDSRISNVTFTAGTYDVNAGTDYTITFTANETLTADPGGIVFFYVTDENGSTTPNTPSFSSTTIGTNNFGGTVTNVSNETTTGLAIRHTEDMAAGDYSIQFQNVVNQPIADTYRFAVSSLGDAPGDATLSSPYSIIDGTSDNPPDDNDNSDDNENNSDDTDFSTDTPRGSGIRITPKGSNIFIAWDNYDNASSYTIRYQPANDAIQEITNIAENQYTLSGLNLNISYTIQILVIVNNETITLSEATAVTTDSQEIANQKSQKPKVPKKKRQTQQVTVKWKQQTDINKYQLQLFKNSKRIRTIRKISGSQNKYILKKLTPETKYQIRLRNVYTTGEKTKYSKLVGFKTPSTE